MIETVGPEYRSIFKHDDPRIEYFQASHFLYTGEVLSENAAKSGVMTTNLVMRNWAMTLAERNPGGFGTAPDIDEEKWMSRDIEPVDFSSLERSKISIMPQGFTQSIELTPDQAHRLSFWQDVQDAKEIVEAQMSKTRVALRRLFKRQFPAERMIDLTGIVDFVN